VTMAYSVMVWLVNPGVHPQQEEEQVRIVDGRESAPGAASGVNTGYAIPRIVSLRGIREPRRGRRGPLADLEPAAAERAPAHTTARQQGVPHPGRQGPLRGVRRGRASHGPGVAAA